MKEALEMYACRDYEGNISMSQSIGYLTESCSVEVKNNTTKKLQILSENQDIGKIFQTLIYRLERRADGLSQLCTEFDLNPNLSTSAHVGFKAPIINVGWGVSVTLTITYSSLIQWKKI